MAYSDNEFYPSDYQVLSEQLIWKLSFTYMHHSSLSTGGMNILGVNVDSMNIENAFVECAFQPGYTCTIDYGTDSSYSNLVYRDNSTTMGQNTTIYLSQDLERGTTYYFSVSAESTSICERVCGIFRIGGCKNSGVQLTQ